MSASPSVQTENQESPPTDQSAAPATSAPSSTSPNITGNASNTSPSGNGSTEAHSNNSKVPPPLLQHQKSNSSHRRRFNSSQQQQPLFSAQYVDPMLAGVYNPNYYPNLYSYGTDFTDIWNSAGAGAFTMDPSLWNGALQSPNDIVFAYPPQFHSFGFASPDAMTAQTLGAPTTFAYDIPAGQQQGGQTSPMVNGAFTDALHQRLREITLSGSEPIPSEEKSETGQPSGTNAKTNKLSTSQDDAASRTWASIASQNSANNNSQANVWAPPVNLTTSTSSNIRGNAALNLGRSSAEPVDSSMEQTRTGGIMPQRGGHIGGILPFHPSAASSNHHHRGLMETHRNFGEMNDLRPIYNAQHIQHAQSQMAEELCRKNDYNPKEFKIDTINARYFIIKSFAEDDVFASVKYSVWCSTVRGNERLDRAFRANEGPVYLFFSVNNTGNFCGIAQMTSPVDFQKDAGCWSTPRWKGAFSVKWIYIKDIPFREFKEITLENNEGKPVFKSRDTQEVLPGDLGLTMLKIFHNYRSQTTLFDDFTYYEEKAQLQQPLPPSQISQNGSK